MKIFNKSTIFHESKGFSLLEVLVGMTLLLILLTAASNGFLRLTLVNRHLQMRSDAATIGRKVIDELRLEDIALLPSGGATETPPPEVIDNKSFDVLITYCPAEESTFCTANQRIIQVDISDPNDDNKLLYSTQTVFTDL